MTTGKIVKLDLRSIHIFERHPRIFEEWEKLAVGETLQIINDHDPRPLHYQFEGEYKDSYKWEYVEKGPKDWVVSITKTKAVEAAGTELRKRVESALNKVRPFLQADGGDVQLVDIDEVAKTVKVRLIGACGGCPSAGITLKAGIEEALKKNVPEIKGVEAV